MRNIFPKKMGERGGLSDFVGFVTILVPLVIVPFMFSFQIFQYYYIQTIVYNSAALTMRVVEVGYSEDLMNNSTISGDYPDDVKSFIKDNIFIENLKMQGIKDADLPTGRDFRITKFNINTVATTPFVQIAIDGDVPIKYARGLIGKPTLPVHIILTGRKTMLKY